MKKDVNTRRMKVLTIKNKNKISFIEFLLIFKNEI